MTLLQARPKKLSVADWLSRQIECLPTIARAAREQKVQLFSSDELILEAWQSHGSYPSSSLGDIFADIEIKYVPPSIRRGLFFPRELNEHIKSASLVDFVKWLIHSYFPRHLDTPEISASISNAERENLNKIGAFKDLCQPLSEKHYGDAFHLWTAEVNQIPKFLACDKKFIMSQIKNAIFYFLQHQYLHWILEWNLE